MKRKQFLITPLEGGKPAGHPIFVEKSVWAQLWTAYIGPGLLFGSGVGVGWLLWGMG